MRHSELLFSSFFSPSSFQACKDVNIHHAQLQHRFTAFDENDENPPVGGEGTPPPKEEGGGEADGTGDEPPSADFKDSWIHEELPGFGNNPLLFYKKGERLPASTTIIPGAIPSPEKQMPRLSPPPVHPLLLQPPAVRTSVFAQQAKRASQDARNHALKAENAANIAAQESMRADMEAGKAAAYRDVCIKYQLHASLIRSVNRLIGQHELTEDYLAKGESPDGAVNAEVHKANELVRRLQAVSDVAHKDVDVLTEVHKKLSKADGFDLEADQTKEYLKKATIDMGNADRFLMLSKQNLSNIKSQIPPAHDPPYAPRRILRPDGEPWFPERPPKPKLYDRQMLAISENFF